MRKWIIISLILIWSYSSQSDADIGQYEPRHYRRNIAVVAVIDTGIDPALMSSDSLCKEGHKDFTGTGLQDDHGHGTHISGIIDQYAKNFRLKRDGGGQALEAKKLKGYCQIILKYYNPKGSDVNNLTNTIKAFRWSIDQKVDIINYSGGGLAPSSDEKALIIEALDKGIKVVVAAGNEGSNIDMFKYYPAMYDKRIYVVGNLVKDIVRKPSSTRDKNVASTSNYGASVNTWELGTDVLSRLPNMQFGFMSGTSQATAVKSGKLVREMLGN